LKPQLHANVKVKLTLNSIRHNAMKIYEEVEVVLIIVEISQFHATAFLLQRKWPLKIIGKEAGGPRSRSGCSVEDNNSCPCW
jgi:hypothetical protein